MKKQFILVSMIFLFGLKAHENKLPKSTLTKIKMQGICEQILNYISKEDQEIVKKYQKDGDVFKLVRFFEILLQEREKACKELQNIKNLLRIKFPYQHTNERTEEEKKLIRELIKEIGKIGLNLCCYDSFSSQFGHSCWFGQTKDCFKLTKRVIYQIEYVNNKLETTIELLKNLLKSRKLKKEIFVEVSYFQGANEY